MGRRPLKITIITPVLNGGRFLDECLQSVRAQRAAGGAIEHIIVDGGSTDDSLARARMTADTDTRIMTAGDSGPAAAINWGIRAARGEIIGWLNADDRYHPGALARVMDCFAQHPKAGTCFGRCRIVNEAGVEIRRPITRFKELFLRRPSLFTIQCLNYVSQPATFYRREILERLAGLREDLRAAYDYDLLLRAWRAAPVLFMSDAPLADFCWRPDSISGREYPLQFREDLAAAIRSAGRFSAQALIHRAVRWGIVGVYSVLNR